MILLGHYATENSETIWHGLFSVKGILTALFGLLVLCGFMFIDWRSLLQKHKLELNFKVLK